MADTTVGDAEPDGVVEPTQEPRPRFPRVLLGEWRSNSRLVRTVVVVELLVLVVAGCLTAYKFRPFWGIDEGAHYDYVEHIARDGRLPVLHEDYKYPDSLVIQHHLDPNGKVDPKKFPLVGFSYEAFQPPLYYAILTPFWFTTSDATQRYKIFRLVGVGFLLATAVVLLILARMLVGRRWPAVWAFALLVLLTPGVIVRSATVGNGALEPLVSAIFVAVCVWAWRRLSYRVLALAALALGACLLTRLVLGYLVGVFVVVAVAIWWRRGRKTGDLLPVAGTACIPIVMLAPWFVFNRIHYDAWTADALARSMQAFVVNPTHRNYSLVDALGAVPDVTRFGVPQEWGRLVSAQPLVSWWLDALAILVIPATIALMIALRKRLSFDLSFVLCVLPLPLAIGFLAASTAIADWPQMLPRYTFGALVVWAVASGKVYSTLFADDGEHGRFVAVLGFAGSAALATTMYVAYWTSWPW
jgi:hypothetical protein